MMQMTTDRKRLISNQTTTGAGDDMDVRGLAVVCFQTKKTGTSYSVKPQGSVDGSTWFDLAFRSKTSATPTAAGSTTSTDGLYEVNVAGLYRFRLYVTAISSATLNAYSAAAYGGYETSATVSVGSVTIENGYDAPVPVDLAGAAEPKAIEWSANANATNAIATATKAATSDGSAHVLTHVVAGFDDLTITGTVTVKFGATTKLVAPVGGGTLNLPLGRMWAADPDTLISAEISAGGSGKKGYVSILGFTFAAP